MGGDCNWYWERMMVVRGFIARAGVDLAFQHQGIASQLGKALIARFQAMGVDQIMGFVDQSNFQVLTFMPYLEPNPARILFPLSFP